MFTRGKFRRSFLLCKIQFPASNVGPGGKLQEVANDAKSMGTTLWFDESDVKNEKRDKIIATGQFTMCYNLVKHICRLEALNDNYKNDLHLQDLKQKMIADFQKIKADPNERTTVRMSKPEIPDRMVYIIACLNGDDETRFMHVAGIRKLKLSCSITNNSTKAHLFLERCPCRDPFKFSFYEKPG